MHPHDDTYIKGQLLAHAARAVGAVQAAAFELRPEGNDTYALELRHYLPRTLHDATAARAADALRRFVLPCLATGKDAVLEAAELAGPGAKRFVLVTLIHDALANVRYVAALLVEARDVLDARRRLTVLQKLGAPEPTSTPTPPAPPARKPDYKPPATH